MQSPSVSLISLSVNDSKVLSFGAMNLRRSNRSTEAEPLNLCLAMYDKISMLSFSFSLTSDGVMSTDLSETKSVSWSSESDSLLDVDCSVSEEL